jgi:hypothetical protein
MEIQPELKTVLKRLKLSGILVGLANCYFAHFSSGSQLNVTMLRWAENG